MSKQTPKLDHQIANAFGNGNIDSGSLAELIAAVEAGIDDADRIAKEQSAKALDINTADARAARDAALTAEL